MTASEVLTNIGVCSAAMMIIVQAVKQVLPEKYLAWLPLGAILVGMALLPLLALAIGWRGELLVNAALVGLFGTGSAVGFYKAQNGAVLPPKG